ncbi:hypothetical protein Pfo_011476 [Paulownia fortunei]|nr:hypothetical protein Pfo_011476 [Paulownia fortunei]
MQVCVCVCVYTSSPAVEKIALHPTDKKLSPSSSSSSSSPDSPLDDPFHNDDGDDDKSTSSTASSPAHKCDRIPVFINSIPKLEPSDHGEPCVVLPTTATSLTSDLSPVNVSAPPNQAMERSASSYRIPSSVFARSQSTTPMEWSVASNESLFSIHTGNMSFRNDHVFWRSGDLGAPGEASTSDQMFSYSAHQSACGIVADMRSRELGLAEATMKEVIKESEGQTYETSLAAVRNSRRSQGSGTSTKSFAFSLMAGDAEKGASSRIPSSVRSSHEQAQSQPQPMMKPEPKPWTHPEQKTPAATGNAPQSKWLPYFSCCSLC